jgi:hypothetical protein
MWTSTSANVSLYFVCLLSGNSIKLMLMAKISGPQTTVFLEPGTYSGIENCNLTFPNATTLTGSPNQKNNTIIDCGSIAIPIMIYNVDDVNLREFTIRRGNSAMNNVYSAGSGDSIGSSLSNVA